MGFTLLHTSQVHVDTFDALAPEAEFEHLVRPDWLERAQGGIDAMLSAEITEAIQARQSTVLCSCTTIGEVAEAAGAIRIDWPMMQEAAGIGGPVLMVYCLESTATPSTRLLERAFQEAGKAPMLRTLPLPGLWHHFMDGNTARFHQEIANWVCTTLAMVEGTQCVVLAQASMADAADLIRARVDLPVLATPASAVRFIREQV